ncbi:MAG: hypothetical protein GWN84_15850 [Gammaproteobacteria bacterium]|nr:hypothetical protein [Gammaproteobacteria bacterium]NIR84257.1 hypothetical protein [Gammaproteobacteria bacterium]NIR89727.1 hypothetical protein [Gammaproteobacteria bacterium]NIU05415.1 hypothetical protein [Gammaproteobacteria bacterium]NIV52361.1 hypothetical protein [Gammaproteobacteria bacterium]
MIARLRPEVSYTELWKALFTPVAEDQRREAFTAAITRKLELESAPVVTPSGRAALYYLLVSHPLRTVYLPAYTCWVVREAAELAGKRIEFLDIEYPGFDVSEVAYERIRRLPGIVVATHQFGFPVDMVRILKILEGQGHFVIEDCAGALFSRLRGRLVGTLGDAAVYSFEVGKLWSVGGGALTCRDPEVRERVKRRIEQEMQPIQARRVTTRILFRKLATEPIVYRGLLALYLSCRAPTEGARPSADELYDAYNIAFSEPQARLGLLVGKRIREIAARRRELFNFYRQATADMARVQAIRMLPESDVCPIRFPFLVSEKDKLRIYESMRAKGIDLGFSFSYALADDARFPGAAKMGREIMNLPIYSRVNRPSAEFIVTALSETLTT